MATGTIEIKLTEWAEGLYMVRRAMSNALREEADAESDPRVQRKLLEIAARFEAGQ
jgi:hypothetical protein